MTATGSTPRPKNAVLLHNGGLSHQLWDGVIAELGDEWNCVAPDLPSFGSSPRLTKPGSLDAYADHVCDLLNELPPGEVILVGSCMGATIAAAVAARKPDLVSGLVVVNAMDRDSAAGGLYERPFELGIRRPRLVGALCRVLRFVGPPRWWLRKMARREYSTEVDPAFLEVVVANYGRRAQIPAFASMWSRIGTWRIADNPLPMPVRVGWGETNPVVPAKNAALIARRLGAPAPTIVAGAAHMLANQRPDAVAALVREVAAE